MHDGEHRTGPRGLASEVGNAAVYICVRDLLQRNIIGLAAAHRVPPNISIFGEKLHRCPGILFFTKVVLLDRVKSYNTPKLEILRAKLPRISEKIPIKINGKGISLFSILIDFPLEFPPIFLNFPLSKFPTLGCHNF